MRSTAPTLDETEAWLRLSQCPGLGRSAMRRLLSGLGGPQQVLASPPQLWRHYVNEAQVAALGLAQEQRHPLVSAALAWLAASPAHQYLTLADPDYPAALLATADPPLLLFLHGRRELLSRPMLAIVGSRHASAQGEDNATAFAEALSATGLCIVSGLALGIDGAAHRGALRAAMGGTIAVLGCGLDKPYPSRHLALARQIAEQGLLLSEYPPGSPARPEHFPVRNRIIAGLSQGCLVVEAALKSGSLLTARLAAEAGREVMAIPGSIHAQQSHGCHALLRDGATLVESPADVLEAIRLPEVSTKRPTAAPASTATEASPSTGPRALLLERLGHDPCGIDALLARTGFELATLNALLLELELDGQLARLPGGLFQRRQQV